MCLRCVSLHGVNEAVVALHLALVQGAGPGHLLGARLLGFQDQPWGARREATTSGGAGVVTLDALQLENQILLRRRGDEFDAAFTA